MSDILNSKLDQDIAVLPSDGLLVIRFNPNSIDEAINSDGSSAASSLLNINAFMSWLSNKLDEGNDDVICILNKALCDISDIAFDDGEEFMEEHDDIYDELDW